MKAESSFGEHQGHSEAILSTNSPFKVMPNFPGWKRALAGCRFQGLLGQCPSQYIFCSWVCLSVPSLTVNDKKIGKFSCVPQARPRASQPVKSVSFPEQKTPDGNRKHLGRGEELLAAGSEREWVS